MVAVGEVNQADSGKATSIDKCDFIFAILKFEDEFVESRGPIILWRLLCCAVMREGVIVQMDPARHA